MRKALREKLIAQFTNILENRIPYLQRCGEDQGVTETPIWSIGLAPELTFFIMLQIFDDKDQFVLEVAGSNDGKFPWKTLPSFPVKSEVGKFRVRLTRLWSHGKSPNVWSFKLVESSEAFPTKLKARNLNAKVNLSDRLPPLAESLSHVSQLVEDAVQKLVEYGLPLFHDVAKQRQIPWNK